MRIQETRGGREREVGRGNGKKIRKSSKDGQSDGQADKQTENVQVRRQYSQKEEER
jgi:hypothetical protein